MRRPKGWYHRYEITEQLTTVSTKWGPKSFVAFHIIKHMGKKRGGSNFGYFRPWMEKTDADLIRRSGIGEVTVPIYVVRLPAQDPIAAEREKPVEKPVE